MVRHGQSVANVALAAAQAAGQLESGITGRDADVPLSPLGAAQAAAVGRAVAGWPADRVPQVVLCSPYLRARHTFDLAAKAALSAGTVLPPAQVDQRLKDRVMGDLELMTPAAIAARYPAEAARRASTDEFRYRPPGDTAESLGDVAARLATLLRDIHAAHSGRRVLLVAHDAVVLMLRHLIDALTTDRLHGIARDEPVANASITRWVRRQGRLRLAEYNMTTHLHADTDMVVPD